MVDTKLIFKEIVANAINEFVKEKEIQTEPITTEQIVVQTTPDASMGDLGVPMFVFAKTFLFLNFFIFFRHIFLLYLVQIIKRNLIKKVHFIF